MTIDQTLTAKEEAALKAMETELITDFESDRPSGPLYHYTSPAALQEIVRSKELWATHFRYLNDSSEIIHGEEIVKKEAESMLAAEPAGSVVEKYLADFLGQFPKLRPSAKFDVYVASLSEVSDQLSQWRAYGGNGAGYALGFRDFPLPGRNAKSSSPVSLTLYRCRYDSEDFRRICAAALLESARSFERHLRETCSTTDGVNALYRKAITIGYRRIGVELPRLKHAAFSEEKEWRLVLLARLDEASDRIRFRSSQGPLIPYMPVPMGFDGDKSDRMKLDSVVVGPGPDTDRAALAAKMLLSCTGYHGECKVVTSGIPYRGR